MCIYPKSPNASYFNNFSACLNTVWDYKKSLEELSQQVDNI